MDPGSGCIRGTSYGEPGLNYDQGYIMHHTIYHAVRMHGDCHLTKLHIERNSSLTVIKNSMSWRAREREKRDIYRERKRPWKNNQVCQQAWHSFKWVCLRAWLGEPTALHLTQTHYKQAMRGQWRASGGSLYLLVFCANLLVLCSYC